MTFSRRNALAAGASLALAACARRGLSGDKPKPIDTKRLDHDFPALANRARPGAFAVGVMDLSTSVTWYWNIDRPFPLANAFVAPLAAAALAEVDAGRMSLGEPVRFNDLDLAAPPSIINARWPTATDGLSATIPVSTLFTLALQQGDNTAADVLMKRIGGPSAVTAWLELKQVTELRVDRYERELQVEMAGMPTFRPAWKDPASFAAARDQVPAPDRQTAMDAFLSDPQDTTTLPGALNFLSKLAAGDLLSPASTALLLKWMEGERAGRGRLRAGLPNGARLSHTAGSTATDVGFTPATNDIGVATLPNGARYAIAAFLAGSTATEPQRDALFADAAKLIVKAAGQG